METNLSPNELDWLKYCYSDSTRFLYDAYVQSQAPDESPRAMLKALPPGPRSLERSSAVALALMAIAFSRYFHDETLIAGLPLNAALSGVASGGDFARLGAQVGLLCAAVAQAEVQHLPRGQPCKATVALAVGRKTISCPSQNRIRSSSSRAMVEHTQYAEFYVKITHAETDAIIREYPLAYEPPETWLEGAQIPQPRTTVITPRQVRHQNFYRLGEGIFAPGAISSLNTSAEIEET
jgi:hypothetical protein